VRWIGESLMQMSRGDSDVSGFGLIERSCLGQRSDLAIPPAAEP
jgi:hypothetical protein